MMRSVVMFLIAMLAGGSVFAAENTAVGTWDCVSNAGSDVTWKLLVRQDEGKLSGSMEGGPGGPGAMALIDPRLDGSVFTFRISVNPQCTVKAKVKIEGDKFQGDFGCEDGTKGTLKATRRS